MIRRLLVIWACGWCALASAQPVPDDAPGAVEQATDPEVAAPSSDSRPSLYIRDQDGRWTAVSDASDAADASDSNRQALPPLAYISQLQFDGQVVGDHADLTAVVRVEVTRTEDWYELPLALDQALIYDSSYTGAGSASPAVPRNGESGVRWQFQGIGTHRLTIKFRLPLKVTAAGRQIQLTLPTLPTNYIARAVLRISDARVVPAEPSPDVALRSRVLDSGETELECDIAGTRWDLAWRTAAEDEPPLAKVLTGMRIGRDVGLLTLTARQECTVEQGAVSEITARLPTDFELESVDLTGDDPRPLDVEPLADRAGWVRVNLGADLQGVFELKWQLTRRFPYGGGAVIVDGLELGDARRQGGTIEIETVDGYAVRYLESKSQGLQRGDVGERRSGEPIFDFRFQFQRQPCLLAYELAPVEARTDADSENFLLIGALRNDLYLDVRLQVLSGQVQEIVIDWPDYAASGWMPGFTRADVEVDAGGAAIDFVNGTLDSDALSADPHQLRLQLSKGCSGSLRTLLHFTREAVSTGALELNLPRPVASSGHAQALTLVNAVNLESTVTTGEAEPPRVPRNGPLPSGVPTQFAGDSVRTYAFSADPPPVTVQWSEQKRTIAAETTLTVEMINSSAVQVSQEIAYDVSYGYVDAVLLETPEPPRGESSDTTAPFVAPGSVGGFRVLLDGGELKTEPRDNLWRVELPRVRLGTFQLTIEHVLPAPDEQAAEDRVFTVPILQAADAPFKTTSVRLVGARLAPSESEWQPWLTRSGDRAWLTVSQRSQVQLEVDDEARRIPQQFTVESAFVRTWFGEPGQASVYGEYALRDVPRSVVVTLPEAAVTPEFRWNGDSLAAPDDVHALDEAPGRFVIDLPVPDGDTEAGRLCIGYRTPLRPNPALITEYESEFPRFGDKVVVNATYWEVVLSPGMQLSMPPSGLVPQYFWERESLLWARRPTAEYLALRDQVAQYEQSTAPVLPRGNTYAYSAVGGVPRGAVGAMAQSLIVLIGAGFSLLLGFVFRRIPATRNMLSLLVLGFLGTLAGLWRLELMQLLLQPALLGLLLAAVAASFDIVRQDRRRLHRDSTIDRPSSASDHRSTTPLRLPAIPARTAVFHPESVSESGTST